MKQLKDLKVELHGAEEKLLTHLRKLRRVEREAPVAAADCPPLDDCDMTTGQRIADTVAATMGSWKFIII